MKGSQDTAKSQLINRRKLRARAFPSALERDAYREGFEKSDKGVLMRKSRGYP